ncbi:Glutamate receptor-interacting protein 1 [Fasciola gigantica]|uniref:Glutamate receptor-interacting protein 1 n=1 Tax=Fasciola gigantica TaxID=46835 RepID=A0A504YYS7_FASGI|nr:Glutamate receptor-interacting protein 1 [Fasciola gigantica]
MNKITSRVNCVTLQFTLIVPLHRWLVFIGTFRLCAFAAGQPLFGRVVVDIVKGDVSSLGLTVSSGKTDGEPPTISSIRPGSVADRCDCLLVDDRIISINNTYTSKLRHEDNVRLVKAAGPWIRLEIQYELPELRTTAQRDQLNKVFCPDELMILSLKSNSLTQFSECLRHDGRIKPGDRILTINNVQTGQLTCEEAIKLVRASKNRLSLVVEYNVANFETDRSVSGAVMVEIEKPGNEDLGISLAPCHEVKTGQNAFFISHIRQGSIGDRCGALFVGDRVESIDDIHVEDLTLQEAMLRLKHNGLDSVRLQIVPNAIADIDKQSRSGTAGTGRSRESRTQLASQAFQQQQQQPQPPQQQTQQQQVGSWPAPNVPRPRARSKGQSVNADFSLESASYLYDHDSRHLALDELSASPDDAIPGMVASDWDAGLKHRSITKSMTSLHSLLPTRAEVCRCEEVEVRLEMDDSFNYGLSLCPPGHASTVHTQLVNFPLVDHVEPGSVAYKSGVIQEGDRVITMNGQCTLNRTVEELTTEFLRFDPHRHRASPSLTLVTQYSVADTVVPTSGVFDVKLVRRAANLGINLQASISKQDGQPLLISKVIPGSVASRSGSINPGDILLAVNGVYLSSCSLAEAIRLLQSPAEEIVTLRIQKIADPTNVPGGAEPVTGRCPGPRRNNYGRSDSVPDSEIERAESVQSGTTSRHKSEPDVDVSEFRGTLHRSHPLSEPVSFGRLSSAFGVETSNNMTKSSMEPLFTKSDVPYLIPKQLENHVHTDPSTSSGQDEPRVGSITATPRAVVAIASGIGSRPTSATSIRELMKNQGDIQSFTSTHDSFETRSKRISSPEDISQDDRFSVVRVTLKRRSAECPWGIIICGTDEASNAPVFIDSLSPGDPGAVSGLLFPGDRILAINGNALHAGHTLTQAMRMLQRYPDRVVLHVARQNRAVATSNFSRSFDSITNSVGSGGLTTNAIELLPSASAHDTLSAVSAPTGGVSARPKSTPCYPVVDNMGVTTPRTRSFGAADHEILVPGQLGEDAGPRSSEYSRVSDGMRLSGDRGKRSHLKPFAEFRQPRGPVIRDWTTGDQQQYSGTSEGGNEDTTTDAPDHPESYPTLTEYTDLDLDSIQCPGCREAILNELRQQKSITQRHLLRQQHTKTLQRSKHMSQSQITSHEQHHPQSHRQRQISRRTRSHHRSFEGGRESSSDRLQAVEHGRSELTTVSKPVVTAFHRDTSIPKAIFYCPEPELPTQTRYPNYRLQQETTVPNPTLFTRHSKSDSRLNMACTTADVTRSEEAMFLSASPSKHLGAYTVPSVSAYAATTPPRRAERHILGESRSHTRTAASRAYHHSSQAQHQHLNELSIASLAVTKRHSGPSSADSTARDQPSSYGAPVGIDRPTAIFGRSQTTGREMLSPEMTSGGGQKPIRANEKGVWCTWIRLTKASASDSYGIGVSEGLSTRGIFVSAIRPSSPADRSGQLHLYDRILMVNDVPVEDLSCSEVVGLISQSDHFLDLLIQRRIVRPKQQTRDVSGLTGRSVVAPSAATAVGVARTSKSPATNPSVTISRRKSQAKRSQHTNLTVL